MSDTPLPTLAPWLARQLRALLAQRGHAWLLQGPPGLGQFDLALALARAWLCDASTPEACNHCPSCHGIDVHTHADLAVLMPEAQMIERGWPLAEKAWAEIEDKKRKPSKEIRIDAMREAIELAQRTSARGRGQAMLVFPAERMNHITANALLKTLEEPPGNMRFALASEAAHLLPATIRSRCQTHTMLWPAEGEALTWLAGQGAPPQEAAALLRAAGGRPAEALAAHQSGLNARQWAQLPRAVLQGDAGAFKDVPLPEVVSRLQKLCHDLIAAQQGAAPRFFDSGALPQKRLSMLALTGWSKHLQQAARSAEHPLNTALATEDLVSGACQALNSKN
ncbi:MAG: DNA polymerase III subunit delta' [Burkholderiaceae bacterium]|jgi:DNA polymerase-3 subunit delta'|nr:DNA polymerase III subunit delta' [Burkholderiaceae bacterium]